MDRNLMISFLAKEAIKSQGDEKGRLWDCIRKANRDVMTGARTKKIDNYCEKNRWGNNETLIALYKIICNKCNGNEPLYSDNLIKELQKNDENIEVDKRIEFGAIQKLVNMTLKYLIILQEFEDTEELRKYEVCEEECECPIDSIILDKLRELNILNEKLTWTSMNEDKYRDVQKKIGEYLKEKYPSKKYGKIWFDFLMWKPN